MTPSATNISKRSEEGMEKREKMRNDRGRKTVPPGSLAEQVDYGYPIKDMKQADMWPTPRATSRMAYHESPSPSMIKGTHGWSLNAAITDAESEDPHRMWPTPAARDYKDTGENTDYEKLAKKSKLSGAVKSEMYPTPRASEVAATITVEAALNRIEKTGYKANLEENVALREQKMFLTPGANEDAAGKPTGKMQRMLGNSPEVRNTGKGTLNPDWVEWLMGYPPGWTDITDLK
jgi:hypothetical protein|tara:strand:+ start:193 stop:894 length:702 start_codon:yes stop_codon:yes gene_type:complete